MSTRGPLRSGFLEDGATGRVPGVDHQRRPAHGGVVDHAQGVAQPRPGVDFHEGGCARRARVGVGHAHGHAFVEGEDELDLRVLLEDVEEPLLRGAGIAEDIPHSVGHQLLHERALAGHSGHGDRSLAASVSKTL
jgi:hypothetical protein